MNQQSTKEKKQLYKRLYAIGASMMFSARKAMDGCDTISADAFLCDTNLKYDKTLEDYIIAKKMGVPRDCVKILIEGQYGGPQHFVDPYKKLLFLEKRLGINIF